ncbi:MAG TPA: tetratricopeptide repeat protein [Sphingomicrobium sp.]|nr:tetratricopeptide repeat protein [Sphingomicrobium sp.]
MKSAYLRSAASALVLGLITTPAMAQRVRTPEQRLDRLERQIGQVQRQVFPKGQPADTAGFSDEPAATATSVRTLDERINGLERQLADILRQSEENGHRVSQMETELARLRADSDQRIQSLEKAGAAAERATETAQADPVSDGPPPPPRPKVETASSGARSSALIPTTNVAPATDPAEAAYDEGYQLWRAGKFDQAIASLRAMASSFPGHRRVSWANNLAGRAMLDKGQARAAAEALLANYRANPKGERAADSLFYLGQSLMKLGQASQACKAYAELEEVYGRSMRGELQRLLPPAKAAASCS